VQRANLDEEHLDTAFWLNIFTGILLTIVGISFSGVVANLFKQPQLEPLIQFSALSLLVGGMTSIQQAMLRRR